MFQIKMCSFWLRAFLKFVSRFLALKGMLHQGLKVKKLNNCSNIKSVVRELRRISLQVIKDDRAFCYYASRNIIVRIIQ